MVCVFCEVKFFFFLLEQIPAWLRFRRSLFLLSNLLNGLQNLLQASLVTITLTICHQIRWTLVGLFFFPAIHWRKFCANGDLECVVFFGRSSTSNLFKSLNMAQMSTNANKWHNYQQLSHTHQLKNDRVENVTHLPMLVICINMYHLSCHPPQHHTLIPSKDSPNKKTLTFFIAFFPYRFFIPALPHFHMTRPSQVRMEVVV